MGAFAGAAQAQSSVTVYGILDVGYIGSITRAANNAAVNTLNQANGNGGVRTQNNAGFSDSAESTGRLGFRGTEDLGGGMRAFFTIETSVSPMGATGVFGASGTGNRQTFVGIGQKEIGQASIGTQYTVIHTNMATTDPGQQNNMMGNVIYDKWAGFSSGQAGATYGLGTAQQWHAGNQNNTSYTVRSGNMLRFDSDRFMGIQGSVFYVANNTTSNEYQTVTNTATTQTIVTTGGNVNNTGWGLGVNYAWKELLVTANYQNFKQVTGAGTYASSRITGAATTLPGSVPGGFGGATQTGSSTLGGALNTNDVQQYYAATYDFGILKAYAQYINRKTSNIYDANDFGTRTAHQIGVRGYITKAVEAWASGGNGRINTRGSGGNVANLAGWQLGSNYWLNKRTNLYAIYGVQSTSNVGRADSPSTVVNPTSYNANNYAIGVRHTF